MDMFPSREDSSCPACHPIGVFLIVPVNLQGRERPESTPRWNVMTNHSVRAGYARKDFRWALTEVPGSNNAAGVFMVWAQKCTSAGGTLKWQPTRRKRRWTEFSGQSHCLAAPACRFGAYWPDRAEPRPMWPLEAERCGLITLQTLSEPTFTRQVKLFLKACWLCRQSKLSLARQFEHSSSLCTRFLLDEEAAAWQFLILMIKNDYIS